MAHPTPQHVAAIHMNDAVDRASYAVESLNALTDLMMVQAADGRESLAHVDRSALAGLLSIVAAEIARELKAAQQHFDNGARHDLAAAQPFTCSGVMQ